MQLYQDVAADCAEIIAKAAKRLDGDADEVDEMVAAGLAGGDSLPVIFPADEDDNDDDAAEGEEEEEEKQEGDDDEAFEADEADDPDEKEAPSAKRKKAQMQPKDQLPPARRRLIRCGAKKPLQPAMKPSKQKAPAIKSWKK